MNMHVFCKVYYDRVYFLCAERIATGSGFQTPAAPPVHLKVECPPPPSIGLYLNSDYFLKYEVECNFSFVKHEQIVLKLLN